MNRTITTAVLAVAILVAFVTIVFGSHNSDPSASSTETLAGDRTLLLQDSPLYKIDDVPADQIQCGVYMVTVCHEECDPRVTPPPGVPCKRIKMCHCETPK